MNRKGEVGEVLQWVIRIGAVVILLALLIAQILMIAGYRESPDRMELDLYVSRLVSGPNGILLHDGERLVGGVVDLSRFNNQVLGGAYVQDPEAKVYGAKLQLFISSEELAEEENPLRTAYNEEELLTAYLPLAQAGLTGKGGALYERKSLPILIRIGDREGPGWLLIEAVKRT